MTRILTSCLFVYLFILQTTFLQAQTHKLSEFTIDDYKKINIPTLDVLFENAKENPAYELAKIKEQVELINFHKERKVWLSYFSIRGSYQYGMFGNESTYTDVYTPVYYNYSTAAQNSYSIGIGISIPLDHLLDLRGRTKKQKLLIKSAAIEREIKYEEMKKEIINLYSNILLQLSILKLNSENVSISNAQYAIAEKDFTNGVIKFGDLSQEKQRQTNILQQYETIKSEFMKSLLILELMTNTPIINQ